MKESASDLRLLACCTCKQCARQTLSKRRTFPISLDTDCKPLPFYRSIRDNKYYRGRLHRTLRKFLQFVLIIFALRTKHLCQHAKPFRLLLFYVLIGAAFSLPKLCSEPAAIDLLAHALSGTSGAGSLPTGVEVVSDENNVKGYRFDPTARLLGVHSEELFPICNRFPAEFSFLITFQHHVPRKTNEFIMALLAPDRHTVLLSIKLQRDFLFFEYAPSLSESKASTSIKSPAIADGRWHTIVITVTLNYVTFTLDCGSSLKRKIHPGFPRNLNIKNSKVYIGSRREKRNRYTGLLRQLILLPGTDASRRVCPSSNPSLATLGDEHGNSAAKPTSNVIFENDSEIYGCSSRNRGTLKYTQESTLEICTGEAYKRIRGGHERMDYVIDYEDIITNSSTISIELFTIPGEGLFIVTANNNSIGVDEKNRSAVFKWNGEKFEKHQKLATNSVIVTKFFTIDYVHYLAVANSGETKKGRKAPSLIFRWHSKIKRFKRHQKLETFGARSVEFFRIDDDSYLFVANHHDLGTKPADDDGPSEIYRWESDLCKFVFYQRIQTHAALDVTFFQIAIFSCIAVANSFDGQTSCVNSDIYCWSNENRRFVKHQSIETIGAADWEFFQFEKRYFLAVANSFYQAPDVKSQLTVNSSIYELNIQSGQFVLYQKIETYGWQGIERFVKVHSLNVTSSSDFDHILIDEEHYLAYANPKGVLSKLYKIVTY